MRGLGDDVGVSFALSFFFSLFCIAVLFYLEFIMSEWPGARKRASG